VKKRYFIPAALLWLAAAWCLRDIPSEGPHVNASNIGPQNWVQAQSVEVQPSAVDYPF